MNQHDWIKNIVTCFYDKAKSDILIGYHFRNIENFDEHIPRIISFWEIQLLGKSLNPVENNFDVLNIHIPLHIKRGELGRWLILFKETIHQELLRIPEMKELSEIWMKKLDFFEKTFSGFFRF